MSLIRSKLEYSSSVWDPHLRKDIHQLEMVQRRAARFIKRDYSYDSSESHTLFRAGGGNNIWRLSGSTGSSDINSTGIDNITCSLSLRKLRLKLA